MGSLFVAASTSMPEVVVSIAMTMTAIAVIGLTYRAKQKRFRLSWDALAIAAVSILGVALLARASA